MVSRKLTGMFYCDKKVISHKHKPHKKCLFYSLLCILTSASSTGNSHFLNSDRDYMLKYSILQVQQVCDVKSRMAPSLCGLYRNKHMNISAERFSTNIYWSHSCKNDSDALYKDLRQLGREVRRKGVQPWTLLTKELMFKHRQTRCSWHSGKYADLSAIDRARPWALEMLWTP